MAGTKPSTHQPGNTERTAAVFDEKAPDLWEWDGIVREIQSGRTRDEVARKHHCSVSTIDRILGIKGGKQVGTSAASASAPDEDGLRALPASLQGDFALVRLTQVVSVLHRDYQQFATGSDSEALNRRLREGIEHGRRVVRLLETQIKERRKSTVQPIPYPQNALARPRIEKQRPPEAEDAATAAEAEEMMVVEQRPPMRVSHQEVVRTEVRQGRLRSSKEIPVEHKKTRGTLSLGRR